MIKQWFVCLRCGHKFQIEVFEEGEAEAKRVPVYPVVCPECGGSVRRLE
jgi:DNA-directed RNA polymerase subunit RPC12/RpoP